MSPDWSATAETAAWRGQDAAVRGPHEPDQEELLPAVDVQVPDALQADRRYIQDNLPAGVRALQSGLLVSVCSLHCLVF